MKRDVYKNLAFVIPLLVFFLAFIVYPLVETFQLSFYKVPLSGENRFVGVKNYVKFLTSPYSKEVLLNTLVWTIGGIVLKVGAGLGVALVLNRSFRGKMLFMSIVLLPWAIPYTISAIAGKWMYNPLYGHLNRILFDFHLIKAPLEWLSDPKFALWGVLLFNSWTGFPFCAFSILSGLYAIPRDLYEAASIDGASGFRSFLYITLPCIRPVLVLVSVLAGMWSFNSFGFIYVMTKGGPVHSSETLVISVYRNMFEYNKPGYGSAIAVLGFVVLIMFSLIYIYYGREGEEFG